MTYLYIKNCENGLELDLILDFNTWKIYAFFMLCNEDYY